MDTPLGDTSVANQPAQQDTCQPLAQPQDQAIAPALPANTIDRLFEQVVARSPGRVALAWREREVTYDQLNSQANHVARALLERGIRRADRVGLYVERSLESVIGMLGILKAGAAYVPLDSSYPAPRIAFMHDDSALQAVLTSSSLVQRLSSTIERVVLIDANSPRAAGDPPKRHTANDIAYIIYTSGSTGRPKGVMVEHRNVVALALNESYAPLGPGDCVAHCASPSFDAATWEVWATLLNGARLVIVPRSVVLDPSEFNHMLTRHGVTALWLTSGLLNEYVDALEGAFSRLRYLLTGGEVMIPSTAARILKKPTPPKHLINAYGPTETTTFATTHEVRSVPSSTDSIPIGKPIQGWRVYILDQGRKVLPPGVLGEIYIGGAGVSRGYLNAEGLTNERFVEDPFVGTPGARMYKTGDFGRLGGNGQIEFIGRTDLQVKVRGFRIELGEVESSLQACPAVKQAAAMVREDRPGLKRLIAYVVLERSTCDDDVDSSAEPPSEVPTGALRRIREYLEKRLPPYMVPAAIVELDCMPLTANGKIDRAALPVPTGRYSSAESFAEPATSVENALCAIWKDALKLEHVSVDGNFFELGGDSLVSIEIIAKISDELNVNLHFMTLFEHPSIRQVGQIIEDMLAGVAPR